MYLQALGVLPAGPQVGARKDEKIVRMESVRRLITYVDIDDRDPRSSIHARPVAEISDGRHLALLDDRGWTIGSGGIAGQTVEDVEQTARTVVGP